MDLEDKVWADSVAREWADSAVKVWVVLALVDQEWEEWVALEDQASAAQEAWE